MALFITFEGGEGAGKSTQIKILEKKLKSENYHFITAQEPGTTLLGRMLKAWLSNRDKSLTLIPSEGTQLSLIELETVHEDILPDILLHAAAPRAELLAFVLARAQLVDEIIKPNLVNNNIVICDRYADSTVAYQGYGRGLDLKLINVANEIATQGIKPDLTILLDLSPEEGLIRKWGTKKQDHFEQLYIDFHNRVREGFQKLASDDPKRWLKIDATKSEKEIAREIWEKIQNMLPKKS